MSAYVTQQSTVYMTLTTTITLPPVPSETGVDAATSPTASPSPAFPSVDYGPQVNFSIWLLTILSFGFLALRIYCKFLRHRGLWWDDHVLTASWICLLTTAATTSVSVSLGYGKHLDDIDPASLAKMPMVANVAGFFSILAALWSKTSFALTLLRISDGWVKKLVWAIIVSTNAIMGLSAGLIWVGIDAQNRIGYFMFSTAFSGAMDVTLAILPWKIIWKMSMTKKEKLGVLFAMSMGVFAGATSFIKITKLQGLSSPEPTDSVQLVIFGAAESAITIIAASIPILRALVRDAGGAQQAAPQFYRLYESRNNGASSVDDLKGGGGDPMAPTGEEARKGAAGFLSSLKPALLRRGGS